SLGSSVGVGLTDSVGPGSVGVGSSDDEGVGSADGDVEGSSEGDGSGSVEGSSGSLSSGEVVAGELLSSWSPFWPFSSPSSSLQFSKVPRSRWGTSPDEHTSS